MTQLIVVVVASLEATAVTTAFTDFTSPFIDKRPAGSLVNVESSLMTRLYPQSDNDPQRC